MEKALRVLWESDVDEANLIPFINYLKGLCHMLPGASRKVEKCGLALSKRKEFRARLATSVQANGKWKLCV